MVGLFGLAACTAGAAPEQLVFDPYEAQNRNVHAFNKVIDSTVVNPVSQAYVAVTPEIIRIPLSNAVKNLAQPSYAVNQILQGEFADAARTTGRFTFNTLLGFGGLADIATDMGLAEQPTGFGETLQVWGVRDGAYLELPLLGPSSERDLAGRVVDYVINPVNVLTDEPELNYLLAAQGLVKLDERQQFAPVINALLYESADSYAALRLSYLQNQRFALEGETPIDDLEDPYAE